MWIMQVLYDFIKLDGFWEEFIRHVKVEMNEILKWNTVKPYFKCPGFKFPHYLRSISPVPFHCNTFNTLFYFFMSFNLRLNILREHFINCYVCNVQFSYSMLPNVMGGDLIFYLIRGREMILFVLL